MNRINLPVYVKVFDMLKFVDYIIEKKMSAFKIEYYAMCFGSYSLNFELVHLKRNTYSVIALPLCVVKEDEFIFFKKLSLG